MDNNAVSQLLKIVFSTLREEEKIANKIVHRSEDNYICIVSDTKDRTVKFWYEAFYIDISSLYEEIVNGSFA